MHKHGRDDDKYHMFIIIEESPSQQDTRAHIDERGQ